MVTPVCRQLHLALGAVWVFAACSGPSSPDDAGPDAGVPRDAGFDAGAPVDADSGTAAPDAGRDAGPDVGLPDAGPPPAACDPFLGLRDDDLEDALHAAVVGHTSFSYNEARNLMYAVDGVDVFFDPDEGRGVLDSLYTGETVVPDGTRSPGNFNTEHTWPQSEGAGSAPEQGDMHHIFPCDEDSNSARGNFPFGDTPCDGSASCGFAEGGSELGSGPGGTVFEVRPARRGDVARAHFYFAVRYQRDIDATEEATLRAWHAQDPPDDRERERNTRVASYQGKRNPFIDCPDAVDWLSDF